MLPKNPENKWLVDQMINKAKELEVADVSSERGKQFAYRRAALSVIECEHKVKDGNCALELNLSGRAALCVRFVVIVGAV